MDTSPKNAGHDRRPEPIGKTELRLMNSFGRELLLKYWDFPLFASSLRRHGLSLEGASILDAGCGSGFTLSLIEQRFRPASLSAFDLVPSQVEKARSRGTRATVFVADITSLDLPAESFDAVFVCGVLHHCREWRKGLAQVARVLKSGGVMLLEEPGSAHLRFERLLIGSSPALESGMSLDSLSLEMGRNGLGILSRRSLYFGLFGSFLCVKGGGAVNARQTVRRLLEALDPGTLAPGQEAPA